MSIEPWAPASIPILSLRGQFDAGSVLQFSRDGSLIVSFVGTQATFHDVMTGAEARVLNGLSAFAYSSAGQRVLVASERGGAKILDAESWKVVAQLPSQKAPIYAAAFSPDGRLIVTSEAQTFGLWDTNAGSPLERFTTSLRVRVDVIAFSPDGSMLAARDFATLSLWDLPSWRPRGQVTGLKGPANLISFSPDGRTLATGLGKGAIGLWNTRDLAKIGELQGITEFCLATAFSPDGRILATGGQDQQVRLWNVETGRLILKRDGPDSWVRFLAFSADGSRLAAGSGSRIHLWASTGAVVRPELASPEDLQSFLASLERIPWLERLGQPSARDAQCRRIRSWEEWPGPEDAEVGRLEDSLQSLTEEFNTTEKTYSIGAMKEFRKKIHDLVFGRASGKVSYDASEDAWHAPTASVWSACYAAELMGAHILLRRPPPSWLVEYWRWFEEGHWPCGYSTGGKPGGELSLLVY
jgi:hypothetical protein